MYFYDPYSQKNDVDSADANYLLEKMLGRNATGLSFSSDLPQVSINNKTDKNQMTKKESKEYKGHTNVKLADNVTKKDNSIKLCTKRGLRPTITKKKKKHLKHNVQTNDICKGISTNQGGTNFEENNDSDLFFFDICGENLEIPHTIDSSCNDELFNSNKKNIQKGATVAARSKEIKIKKKNMIKKKKRDNRYFKGTIIDNVVSSNTEYHNSKINAKKNKKHKKEDANKTLNNYYSDCDDVYTQLNSSEKNHSTILMHGTNMTDSYEDISTDWHEDEAITNPSLDASKNNNSRIGNHGNSVVGIEADHSNIKFTRHTPEMSQKKHKKMKKLCDENTTTKNKMKIKGIKRKSKNKTMSKHNDSGKTVKGQKILKKHKCIKKQNDTSTGVVIETNSISTDKVKDMLFTKHNNGTQEKVVKSQQILKKCKRKKSKCVDQQKDTPDGNDHEVEEKLLESKKTLKKHKRKKNKCIEKQKGTSDDAVTISSDDENYNSVKEKAVKQQNKVKKSKCKKSKLAGQQKDTPDDAVTDTNSISSNDVEDKPFHENDTETVEKTVKGQKIFKKLKWKMTKLSPFHVNGSEAEEKTDSKKMSKKLKHKKSKHVDRLKNTPDDAVTDTNSTQSDNVDDRPFHADGTGAEGRTVKGQKILKKRKKSKHVDHQECTQNNAITNTSSIPGHNVESKSLHKNDNEPQASISKLSTSGEGYIKSHKPKKCKQFIDIIDSDCEMIVTLKSKKKRRCKDGEGSPTKRKKRFDHPESTSTSSTDFISLETSEQSTDQPDKIDEISVSEVTSSDDSTSLDETEKDVNVSDLCVKKQTVNNCTENRIKPADGCEENCHCFIDIIDSDLEMSMFVDHTQNTKLVSSQKPQSIKPSVEAGEALYSNKVNKYDSTKITQESKTVIKHKYHNKVKEHDSTKITEGNETDAFNKGNSIKGIDANEIFYADIKNENAEPDCIIKTELYENGSNNVNEDNTDAVNRISSEQYDNYNSNEKCYDKKDIEKKEKHKSKKKIRTNETYNGADTEHENKESANSTNYISKSESSVDELNSVNQSHGELDSSNANNVSSDYCDTTVNEEDIDFKNIEINVPFPVPLLHQTLSFRKGNINAPEGIPIKKGVFNKEEDEKLMNNWELFCKHHNLAIQPQQCFKLIRIPTQQRLKFLQFLAHGLNDRKLHRVHSRFKTLYRKNIKQGRYTSAEDDQILHYLYTAHSKTPFRDLAELLNRTNYSVQRRYETLLKERRTGVIHWSVELIDRFVKYMMRVTKVHDILELKDVELTPKQWNKLSRKMNWMPVERLKRAWKITIYPRLFSSSLDLRYVKRDIIKRLYKKKITDWKLIDWSEIASKYEGVTAERAYMLFKQTLHYYVPKEKRKDLQECLYFLKHAVVKGNRLTRPNKLVKYVMKDGRIHPEEEEEHEVKKEPI